MIRRIGSSRVPCGGCIALMVSVWIGCSNSSQPTASSDAAASTESAATSELPAASLGDDSSDVVTTSDVMDADAATNNSPTPRPEPTEVAAAQPKPTIAKAGEKPKKKVALAVPPAPEYVYEPTVVMSQRDAATCLVGVGDDFPEAELKDVNNSTVAIKEAFGERLTLVVFWANAARSSREQVQRLPREIVEPFKNTGLAVLVINVGDPAEQTIDILPKDATDGLSLLIDGDGTLYAKVATERIPRVYLLDQDGKILWLDIEYSRSTARDLTNAIHVFLGSRVPSDS